MLSNYKSFIDIAMNEMASLRISQELWKDRLKKEWKQTIKMPRKMKKQKRKEIKLDWQIANYDPFGLNKVDINMLGEVMNAFKEKMYGK
jgi:hypothetical protein